MFRIKQIGMVAIFGLAIVLATTVVYTQSAQAITVPGPGGPSGGIGTGGSTSGQNSQGNDNSQGNEAGGSATGGLPGFCTPKGCF